MRKYRPGSRVWLPVRAAAAAAAEKAGLNHIRLSASLLNGKRLLLPAFRRDEPVAELRRRTAAALGRPTEQVLLVGGTRLLPGTWTLREAFGTANDAEVSVVLTATMGPAEEVMDAGEPSAEYARDFFARLLELEPERALGACDWEKQPDINARMRSILVDWLVDVQLCARLSTQALFLAVSILDRTLERRICKRKDLQLLGVASFSLASKFVDTRSPTSQDWAYLTDWAYTPKQVNDCEVRVLNALNFEVCAPTSIQFLELHERASCLSRKGRHLALYLLELAIVSGVMVGRPPSLVSAAAVYLSHQQTSQKGWSEGMACYGGHAVEVLRPCAKDLQILQSRAAQSKLQAVQRQFSKPVHEEVAKMTF